MTAAARPKAAVRKKKRTPPRLTAQVGYRPAGSGPMGRMVRECYHAVADQDSSHGSITCHQGDALCGSLGPWADSPEGLFGPLVTCRWCRQIAANAGITIIGGDT
jgi:hypothetical protein